MNVHAMPFLPMYPLGDEGPHQQPLTRIPSPPKPVPENISGTRDPLTRTFRGSYLPFMYAEEP
jgi:hypothetical protein